MLRLSRSLALVAAAIVCLAGMSLPWNDLYDKSHCASFSVDSDHMKDPRMVCDRWGATGSFNFLGITFEREGASGIQTKAVLGGGVGSERRLYVLDRDLVESGSQKSFSVIPVELHEDPAGGFREKIDDWTALSSPPLASSFPFGLVAVPISLLAGVAAILRWKVIVTILALPLVVVGILPIFSVQPFLSLAPKLENYSLQLDATRGVGVYVMLAASLLAAIGVVLVWLERPKTPAVRMQPAPSAES
jgi:hypothetical protein